MRVGLWQLLILLAGLVLLAAAPLPHIDSDAPLYARIAANVLVTGDWMTFHHPGWLVDKPPLVFWLMAASFRLIGINDVSMRLWQVLLALALLAVTAGAARAAGESREASLLSALVLGTSLQVFYQVTVPQQDVPLTLFLAIGVYGFLGYLRSGTFGWIAAGAVGVALGVLTKGLAGLALFAVVVLLALPMVRRDLPHPGPRVVAHAAAGALVFALVALPWYIDGIVRHGEPFVSTFLTSGTLGIGRFFRPAISTPPPYWLSVFAYVPLLALGLLPWTPAFLAGLHGLPGVLRTSGPGLRVVVAWFAGIFLVLSLSSGDKVFRYLLPAYPPAAILAGRGLEALLSDRHRLRSAAWLALVPAVALMAAGFWFLWSAFPPERGLLVAVVLPCIGMIAGGLMGFGVAALAGRARAAIAIAAVATMIGYAVFARGMLVHADAINPWPALVRAAGAYAASSTRVVLYGRVGEAFNFAHFYFDEPVVAVTTVTDLTALWARERILIVVPAERLEELGVLRPAPLVLHRSPARIVLIANWSAP